MGIWKRKDSPYWWLWLETAKGQQRKREATIILNTEENRPLAEQAYQKRMAEIAHASIYGAPKSKSRKAWPLASEFTHVYFVTDGEAIKIGRANNVAQRVRYLQGSHSRPLTLLASAFGHRSLESELHRCFKPLRLNREWFRRDLRLMAFIDRLANGADVNVELDRYSRNTAVLGNGSESTQ